MSVVSIDTSPRSQTDVDMALAYEGGGNFMSRLSQLSDLKQQHDEALAELNLGKAAKAALDDAQAKLAAAQADRESAAAALSAAQKQAADTVAKANADAADAITKATASADVLIAEAKQIHTDAQQQETAADAALAAAVAKKAEADVALEAANRLAEQHETARATYEGKIDRWNAFMQVESAVAIPAMKAAARAS